MQHDELAKKLYSAATRPNPEAAKQIEGIQQACTHALRQIGMGAKEAFKNFWLTPNK